ncbi:hybrid sensor histidine kinase/response regulator [Hansschlegelia plantiphila]|uniref:histidine kinase n=1 Tax=Hansschlegelia plantiphila TaxID=374655 RepID=A0A9W6J5Q3_9HYPH|nr:PAS domain-containing sensor histidine kinase [Hansschlegelia plantiphila]GLK69859.1 histidine kinase [Hansschlegelia plantiphila]
MTSQDRVSAGAQNEDRRFRMLVESVFDYAIYMLDPQGFVLTWNRGAERLKGYSEREIVGEHFSRFYTEEDRASGLPERALHTAATEGRFEQEGWRVRKDGARFWAHVVIDPIRDPSGALVGFAKITRDVTADRAADQALRRSEQRFRILVQGVSDYAIYMLDPDGRVTNWNTGAIRFKGYAEDEIVGEHFSRFYTEDDRLAGLPERTLRTARTEGRFEQEGWRVRKDGARFWAHVVVDPIRDESGELIGYAKVTRDLTERREAQLALEQARASLVQAQKMEAVGQLTGGVAHDFNNLLAVILGNLDLARRRLPDGSPVSRLIENSIMAAQRGASLTKRMLAFARKQELKSEVVDVPELVSNMANLLQSSIGPNIHIETRFSLKLPPAVVDGNQLELAIVNLVVNARDAMPDGGVIVIAARTMSVNSAADAHQLAPGEYLCLSVSDAGEGMDEDTLRHAVEPFFTTKGVGKGTGLGLSMIHGFAEQSGGKLILKSARGRGTTAEICLPLAKVAAPAVDRVDESPAAEPALPPLGILVVDDDRLVLMNTAAMLEDLGHHVLEASSGEQALQMLSHAGRLDMVITDQVMPGMSGTELAAEIRRERPDLRIVLATGYADISSIVGPELPRINKPFMQADLEKIIAATRAG